MPLSDYRDAFLQSRFVSYLSDDIKTHLITHAEIVELAPYTYLHRKDDPFNGIYCVLFGKMKATGVTKEGAEYSLAHIMQGAVIGEIAYLDGGKRTHDALALEPTILARFSPELLDAMCLSFPNFYQALVKLACMHIRQSFSLVDDFLTLSPEKRLAKKLIALSMLKKQRQIVRTNQQELSAWIGVSRQSISKILNRWQRDGLIRIEYRQLTLLKPTDLTAIYAS